MMQYEYRVRFDTPAFMGNADQVGQWRTPPFKALLRQWWRMAFAADQHAAIDVAEMRRQEGMLFGVAADGREVSRKSLVRVRLDRWDIGKLKSWDRLEQPAVHHREVQQTGYRVGPHAYLGFGPLDGRGNTKFSQKIDAHKPNAAIQAGEMTKLALAFPATQKESMETALWLAHHFGTLGGRSRNGWGSFSLIPANEETPNLDGEMDARLSHDWQAALGLDWPHAIGSDQQGLLIWRTPALEDWKTLMRHLAEIKIGLRTQFKFNTGGPHPKPLDRHWLSYPVTKHGVQGWGNLRLPNSLRFKVRQDPAGKLYGAIFHIPCSPPAEFGPDRQAIESVWSTVHAFLDHSDQGLSRIPA